MYGSGRGRGGGHQRGSSAGGSLTARRAAELTSAYANLAIELTKKEIKTIGGYSLGRVIGQGAFGKVRLGVHRLTNTRVAIKQVPKSLPFSTDPSSPLSLLTRELHHHRRLRHPHVLALYEIIATESSIYLVSELCTGGELFDYLVEKGRLSTTETRRIFGQLVLGVAHLHRSGVVHRDLKLENVLLDERVNVKIADLGFGREFEKGRWMETWVGTLGYCAPEVVAAKRYLGEEVDIWSLGVILYTLLTGSLPFDDDDEGQMKALILRCEYDIPTSIDDDAADLIKAILVLDPLRRPSLNDILAHPFFTNPQASSPVFHRREGSPLIGAGGSQSHHSHDFLPPVIPEEGSITDSPNGDEQEFLLLHQQQAPPKPAPGGGAYSSAGLRLPLAASELSEMSHVSSTSSDAGPSRSGATTPITSEEGGSHRPAHEPGMSPVREGKQRAFEQPDGLGLIHSNESQSTVGHGGPRGRRAFVANNNEDGPGGSPVYLAVNSPPLTRHFSTSSTASLVSLGGSPVPAHARTPSRTKRRSVGSTFSERLFALDEENLAQARIDYLALLTTPEPAPLTTPLEQTLLDQLTTLGFDTGQIVHSITTDACDASAATWWMLKRKADERERERLEAESNMSGAHSNATSRANSIKRTPSVARAAQSSSSVPKVPEEDANSIAVGFSSEDEDERAMLDREGKTPSASAFRGGSANASANESEERLGYFLHGMTPSASAPMLSYFPSFGAGSSPVRSGQPEPRAKDDNELRPAMSTPPLRPLPTSPGLLAPLSPASTVTATASALAESPVLDSPGSPGGDFKTRRARASSITMLARATSAIGLKKVADGIEGVKSGGGGGSPAPQDENGRNTSPSQKGIFHRKSSLPTDSLLSPGNVHTSPSSPARGAQQELRSLPGSPQRTLKGLPPAVAAELASSPEKKRGGGSGTMSASQSHETFDTISTSGQSSPNKRANNQAQGGSHKGKGHKTAQLFNNFKMWFGDDRRKRANGASSNNKRNSHAYSPQSAANAAAGGVGVEHYGQPLGRSNSQQRRSMRLDGTALGSAYVGSPLKKPPLGSRRSSNGSLGGPRPVSRRSSMNSAHRVKLGGPVAEGGGSYTPLGGHVALHRRRMSESSMASERNEHSSRPPSIRSVSGQQDKAKHRHSRTPSLNSNTPSTQHTQKEIVYRRPPTTTTVRRRHGSQSRHHSRNRSTSSSIGGRPSSSSSLEGEMIDKDGGGKGEESSEPKKTHPILEEDENEDRPSATPTGAGAFVSEPEPVDFGQQQRKSSEHERAQARDKALRQLSGEGDELKGKEGEALPSLPQRTSSLRRRERDEGQAALGHSRTGSTGSRASFQAHKSTHVFGAPSQPIAPAQSVQRKRSMNKTQQAKPKAPLRDVFAREDGAPGAGEDWVDDEEAFGGYGGGLGQNPTRHGAQGSVSSLASVLGTGASTAPKAITPPGEVPQGAVPLANMFQSRYAGTMLGQTAPWAQARGKEEEVKETGAVKEAESAGAAGSVKGRKERGAAFRGAVVIEEEEEEE